jgi:hypothetical protein
MYKIVLQFGNIIIVSVTFESYCYFCSVFGTQYLVYFVQSIKRKTLITAYFLHKSPEEKFIDTFSTGF